MHEFLVPTIGGAMIGLASSLLLLFKGRIFGISSILAGVIKPIKSDWLWKVFILIGLICGGMILLWLLPDSFPSSSSHKTSLLRATIAGLLVGFGTQLGAGCTSGHGVCGISRLSIRSIVATITFIVSGIVTVYILSLFKGIL